MNITSVTIKKVNNESNVKAYATIVLCDCFAIHNIRIIEGKQGLFIAFPSQKGSDDKWYDLCHPITQDFRDLISEKILNEFRK